MKAGTSLAVSSGEDFIFQCRRCRLDPLSGSYIPHASWPKKNKTWNRRSIVINSIKTLKKNGPHKKKILKNKKNEGMFNPVSDFLFHPGHVKEEWIFCLRGPARRIVTGWQLSLYMACNFLSPSRPLNPGLLLHLSCLLFCRPCTLSSKLP